MKGKTYREQLETKCKHFNGIFRNKSCDVGVLYDDVKVDGSPYKFPCFVGNEMSGGSCDKFCLYSKEEIDAQIEESDISVSKVLKAIHVIQEHYDNTGERDGKVVCPTCEGNMAYIIAESNGHIWAKCECGIGFMQ